MRKRARERGEEFGNDPERDFSSFKDTEDKNKEKTNERTNANEKNAGQKKRPLTLFEEIDLRRSKANKPKKDSSKYDRNMVKMIYKYITHISYLVCIFNTQQRLKKLC